MKSRVCPRDSGAALAPRLRSKRRDAAGRHGRRAGGHARPARRAHGRALGPGRRTGAADRRATRAGTGASCATSATRRGCTTSGRSGCRTWCCTSPGRSIDAERRADRGHSVWGADLVRRIPGLEEVARIVRHHHERYDGDGYPDRLTGADIPLASRILTVADAYVAMTEDRPYRQARPRFEVDAEFRSCSGAVRPVRGGVAAGGRGQRRPWLQDAALDARACAVVSSGKPAGCERKSRSSQRPAPNRRGPAGASSSAASAGR